MVAQIVCHTWTIHCNDLLNSFGFHAVQDPVARSGDKVTIWIYVYIALPCYLVTCGRSNDVVKYIPGQKTPPSMH